MRDHDISRPLTEEDRIKGFIKATSGFARSAERWKERAAKGMTDDELAEALAQELGIFGGSCGPGEPWLTFQGAGLKIWIAWEVKNHVQTRPAFQGRSTIAMARLVYGIEDPANIQLGLF
jgi:hypothetical protein